MRSMVKLYAVYDKKRGFVGHFVYLEKTQKFIEKLKKIDLENRDHFSLY